MGFNGHIMSYSTCQATCNKFNCRYLQSHILLVPDKDTIDLEMLTNLTRSHLQKLESPAPWMLGSHRCCVTRKSNKHYFFQIKMYQLIS